MGFLASSATTLLDNNYYIQIFAINVEQLYELVYQIVLVITDSYVIRVFYAESANAKKLPQLLSLDSDALYATFQTELFPLPSSSPFVTKVRIMLLILALGLIQIQVIMQIQMLTLVLMLVQIYVLVQV